QELHAQGRPVLVGTISIENSELLSSMLTRLNIPHTVLNAKYHDKEAEIVKLAGQRSAVTIATNMAGRGTDIVLGAGVADLGGLHVLGTERHEARRIDNQLRGRTGRQGDPGSSQFFLSLEDDLMRIFGSDRIAGIMQKLGMEEGQSIQHPLVSRSIETAQTRVEGHNFDIRKELIKFDDVMNQQRLAIYGERRKIMEGENMREYYEGLWAEIIRDAAEGIAKAASTADDEEANRRIQSVADYLKSIFPFPVPREKLADADDFKETLLAAVRSFYDDKEKAFGATTLRHIERMILLEVIDSKWKDHLRNMDELREGIGLRAYGQKDPVVEFRQEGFMMFEEMTQKIKEDALSFVFRAHPVSPEELKTPASPASSPEGPRVRLIHDSMAPMSAIKKSAPGAPQAGGFSGSSPGPAQGAPAGTALPPRNKVGRNEPCPCGSGKKYKKCCGNA
ncbi:MAG: SEC-C domain-containing protein, partial [Candidatus Omnitrophica bacterium]|nr:SEC-C domain-containing protein [Candidatus Omnitrophota bacterium]